ncbi:cytochrome P450 313a3-like [Homarus americanus]|uniref:Cytochrome P450 313a3-like n=1 Tax=Homarus americanus TaxID=6706 RepID=A0A8J5N7C2_HOMAM|nr:cytochrome P450 313a3-like [Homarus americanus]
MAWLRDDFLLWVPRIWLIEQIPGPKGLPILGNALDVNVEPREFFLLVCEYCDFGNIARIWIGPLPYILVSEAKSAEVVHRVAPLTLCLA